MAKDLLKLKRELLALQQRNRKFLSIEKLVDYCDIRHEESITDSSEKHQMHEYEHQMELWREDILSDRESVRILNESAFHALKNLTLVAAGSAAAILAFLGAIWKFSSVSVREGLADSLAYFGVAIIGSVIAYGMTYVTLLCFFELDRQKRGHWLRVGTIILVVACYLSLILGLIEVYGAIKK